MSVLWPHELRSECVMAFDLLTFCDKNQMLRLDNGVEDDCEDVACVGGTYRWGYRSYSQIFHPTRLQREATLARPSPRDHSDILQYLETDKETLRTCPHTAHDFRHVAQSFLGRHIRVNDEKVFAKRERANERYHLLVGRKVTGI